MDMDRDELIEEILRAREVRGLLMVDFGQVGQAVGLAEPEVPEIGGE